LYETNKFLEPLLHIGKTLYDYKERKKMVTLW